MKMRFIIEDDSPIQISQRAMRLISKIAHKTAAEYWHKNFAPLHFRAGNIGRYGLKSRSKKTRERKRRLAQRGLVRKGGSVSLVWSGLLEKLVRARQIIRAFPTRATIDIPGPKYVQLISQGSRPNLSEEASAVAVSEADKLETIYNTTLQRLVSEHKPRKRIRIQ